ncbi:hypothetical protein AGLY_002885 [Aphis glycines]|uniref:Uncharacterized protein n=1 Tax=Aphis glycines TaxID=307491 RepID=A0A6G0U1M7_APHGL|nr:hypothetical protein AGLY_002885 [Aphis glycines]
MRFNPLVVEFLSYSQKSTFRCDQNTVIKVKSKKIPVIFKKIGYLLTVEIFDFSKLKNSTISCPSNSFRENLVFLTSVIILKNAMSVFILVIKTKLQLFQKIIKIKAIINLNLDGYNDKISLFILDFLQFKIMCTKVSCYFIFSPYYDNTLYHSIKCYEENLNSSIIVKSQKIHRLNKHPDFRIYRHDTNGILNRKIKTLKHTNDF